MDILIQYPLDTDGFVRRQCPVCGAQFKWHDESVNAEAEAIPEPPSYYCPLCGNPASTDEWLTDEQTRFRDRHVERATYQAVTGELSQMFRNSPGITYKAGRAPSAPPPLAEPDDMVIVASPCHEHEPVKAPQEALSHLYCLICGAEFQA